MCRSPWCPVQDRSVLEGFQNGIKTLSNKKSPWFLWWSPSSWSRHQHWRTWEARIKDPKMNALCVFLPDTGQNLVVRVLSLLRGYCRSWCCVWADTGHVLQPGAVPGRWTTLGSGWHRWRAGGRWRRNLHREVGGWERKHELTGRRRRRGDLPASFGFLPYINDPCVLNHRRIQWGAMTGINLGRSKKQLKSEIYFDRQGQRLVVRKHEVEVHEATTESGMAGRLTDC